MADLFVSYSRLDEAPVEQLVRALEAHGLSIWWDRSLEQQADFGQLISDEIEAAKAVVVCWSEEARKSKWVRAEATEAGEKYLGALIEKCRPPPPFNIENNANLVGWEGAADDRNFLNLLRHLGNMLDRADLADSVDALERLHTREEERKRAEAEAARINLEREREAERKCIEDEKRQREEEEYRRKNKHALDRQTYIDLLAPLYEQAGGKTYITKVEEQRDRFYTAWGWVTAALMIVPAYLLIKPASDLAWRLVSWLPLIGEIAAVAFGWLVAFFVVATSASYVGMGLSYNNSAEPRFLKAREKIEINVRSALASLPLSKRTSVAELRAGYGEDRLGLWELETQIEIIKAQMTTRSDEYFARDHLASIMKQADALRWQLDQNPDDPTLAMIMRSKKQQSN